MSQITLIYSSSKWDENYIIIIIITRQQHFFSKEKSAVCVQGNASPWMNAIN